MKKRNLLTATLLAALFMFAYGCGGGGGGGEGNPPNGGGPGANNKPTWQTAPSNITITGGSVYNQTNGIATDGDAGQTLTCSSNGTSCGFGITVTGSGLPANCNVNFAAPVPAQTCNLRIAATDNGSQAMSVGATISITIKNHAPAWTTSPSNITITGGSTYNQTNGVATDLDTGQTVTCSNNGTSCGFGITVTGSGLPANCNVNFTAPVPAQTCNLRIAATDNGTGALSVGATISITINNHAPTWSTPPSNITITGGSVYNQTDGIATDVDTVQTLTCSSNGTSCGFGITVTGSGLPANCNVNFTAPVPAGTCNVRVMGADNYTTPATVGATIFITIKNNAPIWSTAPSNITITGGSVYNQTNGVATDVDGGQMITCSNIGTSCGFGITVTGSGTPLSNCNVYFAAQIPAGVCDLRIIATDYGSPAMSVGSTISITVKNHAPTWLTAPSNIWITTGSVYNQTNGTATDIDAGQTLSCSLASTYCTFGITVGGSGPNSEVGCSINFTAGASSENCSATISVSDGVGGNIMANVNIVIWQPMSNISAGEEYTCALSTAGGVKCWGDNNYGQLGDNRTTVSFTPVDVVGLSNGVAAISAGGYHACALTTAGGVKCWGLNAQGQLGNNTWANCYTPVDVVGLTSGVAAIFAGMDHTCALTTAGAVKCWGLNHFGQLGDNTTTNRNTPVDVVGLTSGVAEISAGKYQHTCALTTAGGVKCWGWNSYGQIGDNTTTIHYTPVDVVGLSSGVAEISAGYYHTCALTTAGGDKCWGYNDYGQIGDNTTSNSSVPLDVVGLTSGVAEISAGDYHTCALTTAGGVKCWGDNNYGQIGDNTQIQRLTPVDVFGLTSGVAEISAGGSHTCALTMAGGVKCWGYNENGELGDNGAESWSYTPVDVIGL